MADPSANDVTTWYQNTYGGGANTPYVQQLDAYNTIGPGGTPYSGNTQNGAGTTGPPAGSGYTTDANGNPISDPDAVALLSSELQSWGFGQDAIAWATQQIQSNNSIDQILYSMRQQTFYTNSVFGKVAAARSANNLPAMTEAQILSYQDYATGVAQQAGLPPGFITADELTQLMGNDVSTAELDARITTAYTAYEKEDPAVQQALQNDYGVTPGMAAAYFLDPNRALPLIQQQLATAQVQGAATTTGYGPVSEEQANLIQQEGVSESQAQTGFTALAKQKQLFNALPGSAESTITQDVQLGAEFGGNAEDQQAISQQAGQREAAFAGNYHYAESQGKGITGLGNVQRNNG